MKGFTNQVTKNELDDAKSALMLAIIQSKDKIEKKIEDSEERINNKVDKVMNLADSVLGEVKAMREEQSTHYLQHERVDQRLGRIESGQVIAHTIKN